MVLEQLPEHAWSVLVHDTPVRDDATTVETAPVTFMQDDGHVGTADSDNFVEAGSHQGMDSH